MTMICVTHKLGFARNVVDRMVFFYSGEIMSMREQLALRTTF